MPEDSLFGWVRNWATIRSIWPRRVIQGSALSFITPSAWRHSRLQWDSAKVRNAIVIFFLNARAKVDLFFSFLAGAGWYRGNILLDESPIGINPSNSTSPSFSASSLSDTSSSSLGSSQRRNKIKSQGCDHDLLTLIVLSKSDRTAVDKFIRDPNLAIPAFEASLISESSVALTKPKTVYLSLTAKQLSVKEYYFLIIPKRIHSFR